MKVIVKESGFYGGTWWDASSKQVDIPETIARPFLPPHGHQLVLPKPVEKLNEKELQKAKG
ncbi:hypothetical protein CES85_1651 [Ochrobactrum quorumnocens]|uniref:Uncharacterized protein n=1 Tax=Ochrobactrum quorumnocens TaxID=271865 RepID=A0A248UI87_9HYPH|nr:hypothetical protein [[Ochrobactrum] quorumnocens]ASV86547.1 hypothetical protein CES85_1651 [[Ochrobactrum] quorumnocens]